VFALHIAPACRGVCAGAYAAGVVDGDRLWKAANLLRGQLDAAAYKHVVLTLLFLRFAASGKSALRVPPAAEWANLRGGGVPSALRALEHANPELRGALPRDAGDVARLDELLDLLGGIRLGGDARDELGRVYEYFLARFARAEGRRGGQFYTPRCVVALLARMLGPLEDRVVYDPCCGAGGMFVQSGARDVFGQESNPATWRLAKLNCALHGIAADLGAGPADTFSDDRHAGRAADVVLANPPFNQSAWGARDDPRWAFGAPPAGNANFAWLQHVLAHLKPGGAAGVVLANGSLTSTRGGEGSIRRRLVEAGWVDAIVALPSHLFFSTTIPACVWILSRAHPGRTLFLDARGLGRMVSRTHRELANAEVDRIAAAYDAYADEPGFARVAAAEDIAARRFGLAPGRYVEKPADAEDAGDARARLARLAAEWRALSDEAERVAAEISELDLGLS